MVILLKRVIAMRIFHARKYTCSRRLHLWQEGPLESRHLLSSTAGVATIMTIRPDGRAEGVPAGDVGGDVQKLVLEIELLRMISIGGRKEHKRSL